MSEKRHPPSKRKLERAIREGKLVKSRAVTAAARCAAGAICLHASATQPWVSFRMLVTSEWRKGFSDSVGCASQFFTILLSFVGFWLILVCAAGLAAEVLQTRLAVSPVGLTPSLERMSPMRGAGRIRSGLANALWFFFRLLFFTALIAWKIWSEIFSIREPLLGDPRVLTESLRVVVSRATAFSLVLLGSWAAVEYLLRRRQLMKELAMSDEEIRREQLESEGHPLFRAVRRHMHEALVMQDLIARIRQAKVIVVERA